MTAGCKGFQAGLVFLLITVSACGSGLRLYTNPQADPTFYNKVVVVPFSNLTQERFAGEKVMRAFVTELLISQRFQVVEQGEFTAALDKIGGMPGVEGRYDPEKLKQAATQLEATGYIQGAVSEFEIQRVGGSEFPVLSFDVEMIDVATGNIVWHASISRKGKGRFPIFGGSGMRAFGSLMQSACEDLVGELSKKAF